jgi:hypothetical protein
MSPLQSLQLTCHRVHGRAEASGQRGSRRWTRHAKPSLCIDLAQQRAFGNRHHRKPLPDGASIARQGELQRLDRFLTLESDSQANSASIWSIAKRRRDAVARYDVGLRQLRGRKK